VLHERSPPAGADGPLVLDRYRLQKRIGAGGFGTVWAAHDERLEREVAVKIVPRERVVHGRFEREARAAARLSHPAIVTLYEAAIDDEGAYLVSELVRGGTLHKALDAGKLSDREIVLLGITLCEALEHAHDEGVVHRDVKPSNILLPARTRKAGTGNAVAKLTDFGVARFIGGDSLTHTGDVLGTAAYMAPEQAEGLAVGPEADLYSLALVLYEALTGVNPVRTTGSAVRARRLGAHLPPLRRQRRDLPRELGAGIDLALRPRSSERGTMWELRNALEVSVEAASEARGIVTAPWTPIRGQRSESPQDAPPAILWAPSGRQPRRAPEPEPPPPEVTFDAPLAPALPRPMRGAAAAAAAAIAWWPASLGLTPISIPAALYALVGGLVTLVAPLHGYVLLSLLLPATVAASGHAGAAIVLFGVLTLTALLMPGRSAAWPLPAGAVGLAALGLAGAWPAAAARLSTSLWRRAALGGTGIVWIAAAAELAGRDLFLRRPPQTPQPLVWTTSAQITVHHVVSAIFAPQILATSVVWALAATVLPWLATGRRGVGFELVAVTAWAATTVAATAATLDLAGHRRAPAAGPAVLGALVGAIIALWPVLHRVRREAAHRGRAEPELP
jgi:serine/threonine protein kinase